MNDDLTAWFHCGRCASLFRTAAGPHLARRCTVCGEDPAIGLDPDAAAGSPKAGGGGKDPMLRLKMAEVEKPKFHKREVRRQKGRYFAMKLVLVWMLLMVALAVGGHFLWREQPREEPTEMVEKAARNSLADEDFAYVNRAYGKCVANLSGFLAAGTPEVRNQFVRTPLDTARRMARFYQSNPFGTFDVKSIKGTGSGVIHLKDGRKLVETRWAAADGRSFDAVFFDEQGDWRLDWEEFVRFSEHPWLLFLSEPGDGVGEFRLFARERLSDQRNEVGDLRIALHAPRFGHPGEAGEASTEFTVDQQSESGKLLLEAFRIRKDGGRVYGSTLPNQDPEGMIRVRVKIRRADGTLGRSFTIEEVKACHWLSIDDPGLPR
ncbi:hypothetical protein OVA24_19410 [Luteolibacter sp. SL250]|uniref:hypothetical protein n=1 Tax=Luteolibacter sp. SL250 TaxID=2995170 RepID=UPI0022700EF8|nr:hypothetical protein [Luteolibacter sp. SL250]WAC19400.1 hypothetical protein OVA24_19410 [Luteolibacter sp. SL250]